MNKRKQKWLKLTKQKWLNMSAWKGREIAFWLIGGYDDPAGRPVVDREDQWIKEYDNEGRYKFDLLICTPDQDYRLALDDLFRSVAMGKLSAQKPFGDDDVEEYLFDPQEVILWAKKRKETYPDFPFLEPETGNVSQGKWPWGDYETENLQLVEAAITHFHSDLTSGNIPTVPDIVKWLQILDKNIKKNRAEHIAAIIRPHGIPPGRR